MKRALCVAAVLLLLGPVAFVTAGFGANSQSESVVITENSTYGDAREAEGLRLRVVSHWRDNLVWDAEYLLGSGETESSFSFYPYEKKWKEPDSASFDMNCVLNWGTVYTSGPSSSYDPERGYLPEVIRAVMDRTGPGERRTETVHLAEYYEYYPLNVSISKADIGLHYHDDENFFTDYFRIPVPEWMTVKVTLEKDEAGDVVDVQCCSEDDFVLWNVSAFGQEGGYDTYCLEYDAEYGSAQQGEDYGIYFFPYEAGQYRNSADIDTGRIRKVCDLQQGIWPVDMKLNESLREVYLMTKEGQDYYLNVYQIQGETLSLSQKLHVRSVAGEQGTEENPYWVQMSVREEGVLMVWNNGSFAFANRGQEGMELWCLEKQPGNEKIFPYEHVWAFDGQRLALAYFADWDSLNVEAIVYRSGEPVWCGILVNSGEVGNGQAAWGIRIKPPGTIGPSSPVSPEYLFYRRRTTVAVEEMLGLEWDA